MATWHLVGKKSFNLDVNLGNPISSWEVTAPPKVEAGKTVTITVKAYARRPTQVRATVNLFGKTQTKTAYAYSTTTPAVMTFSFTAPMREDRYTGTVTLEAYY